MGGSQLPCRGQVAPQSALAPKSNHTCALSMLRGGNSTWPDLPGALRARPDHRRARGGRGAQSDGCDPDHAVGSDPLLASGRMLPESCYDEHGLFEGYTAMRAIEKGLFLSFAAIAVFAFALVGFLLLKSLGVATFSKLVERGASLMDEAGPTAWLFFGLLSLFGVLLFFAGVLLATKSRWLYAVVSGSGLHPSTLQVDFGAHLNGCRAPAQFADGTKAIFFRLWVRPSKRPHSTKCTGTIVDVLAPLR